MTIRIDTVAASLSYHNAATFRKALRRWTGIIAAQGIALVFFLEWLHHHIKSSGIL